MKTKLFILPILTLMAVSVLSSCSGSDNPSNNPYQPDASGTSKPSSGEPIVDDGRHHADHLNGGNYNEGLLTYENPNTPKPAYSGGGLDIKAKNTKENELMYNYNDLGSFNLFKQIDYMPSTGDVNLLVIPVKFTDIPLKSPEVARKRIYDAYFGTEEDTGYESVATYFEKSSYGTLNINGVVSDWYACDWSSKIYSGDEVCKLTNEAFEWYKKKYNTSGSEFDADKDGYVDAICLIYNAPTKHNNNQNLWAYCFWTQPDNPGTPEQPVANAFFFASLTFLNIKPGVKERKDPIKLDTHTFIHELGHVMGLEDYYSYDVSHRYRPGSTGGFIMQDNNVGDHDPFSKLAFGWTKPTLITGSTTVKLSSFTETGQVLIFKLDDNFNSPFDEYLAAELYTPTGLNKHDSSFRVEPGYAKGPKTVGVRLWHVDSRLLSFKGNNTTAYKYNISNEIKNGYRYHLAMSNTNNEERGSLVPEFRDYKLLHCIQAGGVDTYETGSLMKGEDLFTVNKSFSMRDYANFFVNPQGRYNSGGIRDFKMTVTDITNDVATIEVVM